VTETEVRDRYGIPSHAYLPSSAIDLHDRGWTGLWMRRVQAPRVSSPASTWSGYWHGLPIVPRLSSC
jgi:hypothetical protein